MKKEEKQKRADILTDELENATGIYFLDFTGISAQDFRKLRTLMRNQNVKIKVVKNIIAKMTVEKLKLENLLGLLEGPTAISYSYEDPIIPSKIIADFRKDKEIKVKGGLVEGDILSSDQIIKLAKISSKEELIQQLLFALSNPLQRMHASLRSPIEGLAFVLNQVSQKQK